LYRIDSIHSDEKTWKKFQKSTARGRRGGAAADGEEEGREKLISKLFQSRKQKHKFFTLLGIPL